MNDFFHIITNFVIDYGFAGIFVLMLLENLGIPLPTEVGFIAGQALILSGKTNYLTIFLVVLAAYTLGSILSFFLGEYFAEKIHKIKQPSSSLKRAQETFAHWMSKYGNFAVFISRLVGYVRPWASYLAGIGEIKFIPFILYNILGSAIIIILSMSVFKVITNLYVSYPALRFIIIAILVILFIGFWIGLAVANKIKSQKKN